MASRGRSLYASYEVDLEVTQRTEDHEDHAFCGIMFDVKCRSLVPLEYVVVRSVWVRGNLGYLRVFATEGSHREKKEKPEAWRLLFEGRREPSPDVAVCLSLDAQLRLCRGETAGLYVHSSRNFDDSIVYDDVRRGPRRRRVTDLLEISPGSAHLGPVPFSSEGAASWASWRSPRDFVGSLQYGVRYALWCPQQHPLFPAAFRAAALALLLTFRRLRFSDDITFYVLNTCPYDWFKTDHINPGPRNTTKLRLFRRSADRVFQHRRKKRLRVLYQYRSLSQQQLTT